MSHHSSADKPEHREAWDGQVALAGRPHSVPVRFITGIFWTLIAALLLARLLVGDPTTASTAVSTPQPHAAASAKLK